MTDDSNNFSITAEMGDLIVMRLAVNRVKID